MKILNRTLKALALAFLAPPTSGSVVIALFVSLLTCFEGQQNVGEKYKNKSIYVWRHLTDNFLHDFYIFFLANEKRNKTKK